MAEDPAGDVEDLLERFVEQEHGYLSWLGTSVETFDDGTVTLAVPFDEKLTNPTTPPTMHGGIAATLIDTAGGIALRSTFEDAFDGGVATINLNVNYLRRAAGDMRATAEVIRTGGSVGVSQVTVTSETPNDGVQPVAVGQGAYRLFRD
jgi:uncharacterized protein (TIGR00369 family)